MNIKFFTAEWCGPCKSIKPEFHSLMIQYPHHSYEIIDIDTNPQSVIKNKIKSIPTFIVDNNTRMVGAQGFNQLKNIIK